MTAFFVGAKKADCVPIIPSAIASIHIFCVKNPRPAMAIIPTSARLTQRNITPRSTLSAIWPAMAQKIRKGPVKMSEAIGTFMASGTLGKKFVRPAKVIKAISAFFSALSLKVPASNKT